MHPKRLSPLSAAARMMGKKGGKRTLELYGAELFSKASKARKVVFIYHPETSVNSV